jgi:hypothetical protein
MKILRLRTYHSRRSISSERGQDRMRHALLRAHRRCIVMPVGAAHICVGFARPRPSGIPAWSPARVPRVGAADKISGFPAALASHRHRLPLARILVSRSVSRWSHVSDADQAVDLGVGVARRHGPARIELDLAPSGHIACITMRYSIELPGGGVRRRGRLRDTNPQRLSGEPAALPLNGGRDRDALTGSSGPALTTDHGRAKERFTQAEQNRGYRNEDFAKHAAECSTRDRIVGDRYPSRA